jgi:aminoglycoside phosphotransferase (APT) family kinase protein
VSRSEVADAVALHRLAPWVVAHVDGAAGEVMVDQLAGGSSNLTFRVRSGGRDLVLRRPPAGRVLATANDVLREHRVQAALAGSGVPVARMVAACDDVDVIGAPFYLMEHLDGIVYADSNAVAHLTETDARAASDELVDVLARLHGVDPIAVGLGDLGRSEGFVARQVERWCTQWDASKQRSVCDARCRHGRARASSTATTASTTPCGSATSRRACRQCSTGRWRPSAIPSPTSGCS